MVQVGSSGSLKLIIFSYSGFVIGKPKIRNFSFRFVDDHVFLENIIETFRTCKAEAKKSNRIFSSERTAEGIQCFLTSKSAVQYHRCCKFDGTRQVRSCAKMGKAFLISNYQLQREREWSTYRRSRCCRSAFYRKVRKTHVSQTL